MPRILHSSVTIQFFIQYKGQEEQPFEKPRTMKNPRRSHEMKKLHRLFNIYENDFIAPTCSFI